RCEWIIARYAHHLRTRQLLSLKRSTVNTRALGRLPLSARVSSPLSGSRFREHKHSHPKGAHRRSFTPPQYINKARSSSRSVTPPVSSSPRRHVRADSSWKDVSSYDSGHGTEQATAARLPAPASHLGADTTLLLTPCPS
ncbi:hypothetical protein KUCAC02_004610, partial [Chaenocephalus aceratus]